MMRLVSPQWLVLLPILAAVAWRWPALGLWRPPRAACMALVVLLLAGPEMRRQGDGLDLWLLVDRSESAEETVGTRAREWEAILAESRGPADRLLVVDFADESVTRGAILRAGAGGGEFSGKRGATRLAGAARHALAQARSDRATRILALTDGFSTEPLDGLAETLRARDVPLDLRLAPLPREDDFSVASLVAPRRVGPREGVLLETLVRGSVDARVPVEVWRDGQQVGKSIADVVDGEARPRFSDLPATPGAHRYEVRVAAEGDARPGNDAAGRWVEVAGGPRILLASAWNPSPLAAALRAQGHDVVETSDPGSLHVGMLAGARAVILDGIPAHRFPVDFIRALEFFVTAQGGGLAMIGGRHSFAGGGWAGSVVDPLLPVSLESKAERRKLAVAMAIVLDRSGSMSMTAPGSNVTKMALADEGAARSIELLGDQDLVVVIPVDSEAHPLSSAPVAVGPNRESLARAARGVTSGGGGIYCYTGLASAWSMLRDHPVGQRHVILFADAADAEEPGAYVALLEEMQQGGCTVSVIGLGTERDRDAALLSDIAARGGGRIFFSDRPDDLPALFQMETATVARSAFVEEPVAVAATPGWLQLAAAPLDWPGTVDAHNVVELRPGASTALVTSGEEEPVPLVAFWQRGAGRTASVALPLGGPGSEGVRGWEGYAPLAGTLARWLAGSGMPEGIGLRTTVEGSALRLDLLYDDAWSQRVAAEPPRLAIARGRAGAAAEVPWEKQAPGHFSASVDIADAEYVRAAVTTGDVALSAGPLDAGTNPEWTLDPRRRDDLRAVSRATGGAERDDLAAVWRAPRPRAWRGLHRELLTLLLAAILGEALATQAGWQPRVATRGFSGAAPAASRPRAPRA